MAPFSIVAHAGSDVDLLVVGSASFAQVVEATHATQAQLGREINPTLYSRAELKQRIETGNSFVTRVLAQPRIWLLGGEHELAA